MRKLLFVAASVAALVVASSAATATVAVSITRAGFVPNDVSIRAGDTVTWTNNDTQVHQVVSQAREDAFASPPLQSGQTFVHTFRTAGRFTITDPLNRNRRMTVRVAPAPASVTISARPQSVVYGGAVTLSGAISSQQQNQRVSVLAQPCGQASFAKVADVTTTAGGAWTLAAQPVVNTVYQAQWRNVTSAVTVRVRPRIVLRRLASRRFRVRVLAAQSLAGRAVAFQRYRAATRTWVRVRTVFLRPGGTATAPTVVSAATFRARVRRNLRVRVVMGQAQVGPCYLPGRSNVVRS